VPADPVGTITAGGSSVTTTTTTPGQNAKLTFTGTSGQRVSLNITNSNMTSTDSILRPDGTTLVSTTVASIGYIDATTLPSTGTYTVLMDGAKASFGNETFTLYDVHDLTGSIPTAPPSTFPPPSPGKTAPLTSPATAGQRVSLAISPGPLGTVAVKDPSNATIGSASIGSFTNLIEPITMAGGTYT